CGPVLSSTPCVLRSEATGTTVPSRSHSSTASPGSRICGTTTRCTCSHGTKPRAPNIVDQDTPRSSSRAQARRASRNSVIPAAITRSPRSTTSTALTTSLRTSSATEYSAVKNPMNTSTAPAHISPELDPARTVVDPISIPPRGVVGSALGTRLLDGRLAELDVPGEDLLARAGGQLELLDPAQCRQIRGGGLQVCQLGLRRLDGDGEERGLLRDLRVGLDAAQHDRRLRDRVHQGGVLALGGLAQRRGDGPRLGVPGAAAPPRPHLLGREHHHGREQAQQLLERDRQRGTGRGGPRLAGGGVAVGALLGQLDVVVAERPEERFDDLEAARVVQLVEGGGGLL